MLIPCMCWCMWLTEALSFYMPKIEQYHDFESTNPPVFVTKFIGENRFEAARNSCMVPPLAGDVLSYAGFLTVKETFNYKTNFFFWYFPTESLEPAPLILHLLGGIGGSCLFSIFEGFGPFYLHSFESNEQSDKVKLNRHRLTKSASVLYVDHPAGAGYSFTGDDLGYSYTKEEIAGLLLEALRQFFTVFPGFMSTEFYIFGESYSASYVPALVDAIIEFKYYRDTQVRLGKDCGLYCPQINLTGVIISGTFFDPIHMLSQFGKRLENLRLIDENATREFQRYEDDIHYYNSAGKIDSVFKCFDKMVLGGVTKYPTLFENFTSNITFLNYYEDKNINNLYHDHVGKFIQSSYFRNAIHVGNCAFNTNYSKVLKQMRTDIMTQLDTFLFERILEYGYRALIVNGFEDLLIPYSEVQKFLSNLRWTNKRIFKNAAFFKYRQSGQNRGQYKRYGSLYEMMLFDVGHIVSKDDPMVVTDMLIRFINKQIFNVTNKVSYKTIKENVSY